MANDIKDISDLGEAETPDSRASAKASAAAERAAAKAAAAEAKKAAKDAADKDKRRAKAAAQGPAVRIADREEKKSWRPKWLQYTKNNKIDEVSDAVRSLGLMLSTAKGETVPLLTLSQQFHGTELGLAFGRIYQQVMAGSRSMAEAFRDEGKLFPRIVADLLFVGARSGTESQNLQKASDIIDEGQDLLQKIKSALMQPAILLGVIIAFLYAVILFVLPVFNQMFKSFGKPLPPLSKAIIAAGNYLIWGGGAIAIVIVLWLLYYHFVGKKKLGLRVFLGRLQLRLPVLGRVFRAQMLTQMFSILSGLLSVGMNEREALLTAAEASSNAAVKFHLQEHVKSMDSGQVAFSDLADGFIIPLQAGYMLKNGFDSGAEIKAMEGLTTQFRRDANKRAENLTRSLEPIANGLVGVIFVFVIVATYLPVYDMFLGLTQA